MGDGRALFVNRNTAKSALSSFVTRLICEIIRAPPTQPTPLIFHESCRRLDIVYDTDNHTLTLTYVAENYSNQAINLLFLISLPVSSSIQTTLFVEPARVPWHYDSQIAAMDSTLFVYLLCNTISTVQSLV